MDASCSTDLPQDFQRWGGESTKTVASVTDFELDVPVFCIRNVSSRRKYKQKPWIADPNATKMRRRDFREDWTRKVERAECAANRSSLVGDSGVHRSKMTDEKAQRGVP
mmetsp:Transcript_24313/g.49534  ORF Transcript_24313/g.49534 Transcript_24313/m.49534 type:complete len:109 (+) Transcript_24313:963-1289(+)